MGLIGNSATITTHDGSSFVIQEKDFVGQGLTMKLSYSQNISVNTNGRLLHRGGYLKSTFDFQIVLPLADSAFLYFLYSDYLIKQRGGYQNLNSWQLENNRTKSVGNGFGALQFNFHNVYPENMVYNPLNNEWAEVNINLTTHGLHNLSI